MASFIGRSGVSRPISAFRTLRRWLPMALVAAGGSAALQAQQPTPPQPKAVLPMAVTPGTPAPPVPIEKEKVYVVAFKETSWPAVFDWFAKETGLTYLNTVQPPGNLTIQPPPGRTYTLPQIFDLLNEALAQKKMVIVRKGQTFSVHPADDRLAPELVAKVTPEELSKYGDTEIVQVALQLTTVLPEDIVPQMKKLLSQFGSASQFGANDIIVLDKARNIRNIQQYINEAENGVKDKFSHQCKYVRASAAAEKLRALLVDANTTAISPTSGAAAPGGGYGGYGGGGYGGYGGGGYGGYGGGGYDQRGGGGNGGSAGRTQEKRFRSVQLSVDYASNTVMLTGPADKIVAAKSIMPDIDKGDKPRPNGGQEFWKTYTVASGTAEALAKAAMASPEFKGSNIQMLPQGTSAVMVYGFPADHLDVANYFKMDETSAPTTETEFIQMNGGDPTRMAATLSKLMGGKGLVAEARTEGVNGIFLRGTKADISEAKGIMKSDPDGGNAAPPSENLRIITIDRGNAGVLAEEIGRMMGEMGYKPKVNGGASEKKPEEPKPMQPPGSGRVPAPGAQSNALPAPGFRQVSAQLADPQKDAKPPVSITVFGGDKIVIAGEDPRAVQLAYELLTAYLKPPKEGATVPEVFEVIKLKNASAVDAAAAIDEIFNGKPQGQGGAPGGNRGGGGGGGGGLNPLNFLSQFTGGGGAPASPTAGRIRVFGEKNSNSLVIVKASKLDVLTIKGLLKGYIDNDDPPEGGVSKTHLIQLQYAKARELAPIIRNVYATQTGRANSGPAPQQPAGFAFPGQVQQRTAPSNVALTVEYEDNTNKLIVNCVEPVFVEIEKLAKELDKAAKDSAEVVDVIAVPGLSPTQVYQALEAMAGRMPQSNTNQRGFAQGGNFGGGGFGNQGGFGGGFGNQGGFGGGGNLGGGNFGANGFNRPQGGGLGGFGGGGTGGFGGGGLGGGGTGGGAGGGRGGFGGTGGGGGGGTRGGTGGGGGTRGGGRTNRSEPDSYLDGGGGRDFFEDRDTDVPSAFSVLFDPETERPEVNPRNDTPALYRALAEQSRRAAEPAVRQVRYLQQGVPEENPPTMPPPKPLPAPPVVFGQGFQSPSADVTTIPLEGAGVLVVRGSKEEVARIREIIAALQATLQRSVELKITIVPLKKGDATLVVNELTQLYSRLQFGAGATIFPVGNGFGANLGNQQQANSQILFFPLPRLNSILLAVPKAREEEVLKQIDQFDTDNSPQMKPVAYPLKRASAQNIATQVQNFFNQRYPNETLQADQIRITYDVLNNTVYVQASPADQNDIRELIQAWDSSSNAAKNDVRVFRLRNALSDELSQVLIQTLIANTINPQVLTGGLPTTGGGGGGVQNAGATATPGINATGSLQGQVGNAGRLGGTGQNGLTTKFTGLRFKSATGTVESEQLEDVHIISDPRINALVITASEKTMQLLELLVAELDGVSAAKAFVNVFQLKKADAQYVQQLILNLFSGTNTSGAGGGLNAGGFGTTTQQGTTRPLLTLTNNPSDGATLINLRLTADPRTNTLVVAGSQNDIDLIRAVIARLEDSSAPQFVTDVYKLRNAAAADVQLAIQTFLQAEGTAINAQFVANTTFLTLPRQFVITPEPVSNTLLVSATPDLFDKITKLIERIDATPQQVLVQVLIADVQLSNNEEFGVEIGLQSDVLFARGQVAGGSATAPGTPGFNFNTTAPLGNTNLANPGLVGFQGLGNLGVGRVGGQGVGGFVFSASNDTFSLLVRALKTQGRLDLLSRPQLLLTDNQTGFFQVGSQYPLPGATTITNGLATTGINYTNIGVVMRVTPRISPDGRVLMRIEPNVSSPGAAVLINGVAQPSIDTQAVETTVMANDGETIVLGGLIRKSDQKNENKFPVLGDLPYVGSLFRYRSQTQTRRELLFIMTPHIVRCEADMQRLMADEWKRHSGRRDDIACIHGHGMELIAGKGLVAVDGGPVPTELSSTPRTATVPATTPVVAPQATLPASAIPQYPAPADVPQTMPGTQSRYPLAAPLSGTPVGQPMPATYPNVPGVPLDVSSQPVPGKDAAPAGWNTTTTVPAGFPPVGSAANPAKAKEGRKSWVFDR